MYECRGGGGGGEGGRGGGLIKFCASTELKAMHKGANYDQSKFLSFAILMWNLSILTYNFTARIQLLCIVALHRRIWSYTCQLRFKKEKARKSPKIYPGTFKNEIKDCSRSSNWSVQLQSAQVNTNRDPTAAAGGNDIFKLSTILVKCENCGHDINILEAETKILSRVQFAGGVKKWHHVHALHRHTKYTNFKIYFWRD